MPPEPQIHAGAITIEPERTPGAHPAALTEPTHYGSSASAVGQSAEMNAAAPLRVFPAEPGAAADPDLLKKQELARNQIDGMLSMVGAQFGETRLDLAQASAFLSAVLKSEQAAADAVLQQGAERLTTMVTVAASILAGGVAGAFAAKYASGALCVAGQAGAAAINTAMFTAIGALGPPPPYVGEAAVMEFVRRAIDPARTAMMAGQRWFFTTLMPVVNAENDPIETLKTVSAMEASVAAERATFVENVKQAVMDAFANTRAHLATDATLMNIGNALRSLVPGAKDEFSPAIGGLVAPEGTANVKLQLADPSQTPQVISVTPPGHDPNFKATYAGRPLKDLNIVVRLDATTLVHDGSDPMAAMPMSNSGMPKAPPAMPLGMVRFVATRAPAPGTAGSVDTVDVAKMPLSLGEANPAGRLWLARYGADGAPIEQATPDLVDAGIRKLFNQLDNTTVP